MLSCAEWSASSRDNSKLKTFLEMPVIQAGVSHEVVDTDHAHGTVGGALGVTEGSRAVQHGGSGAPAPAQVERRQRHGANATRHFLGVECIADYSPRIFLDLDYKINRYIIFK